MARAGNETISTTFMFHTEDNSEGHFISDRFVISLVLSFLNLSVSFFLHWIILLALVHRAQGNNVKYLKAKLGYRKIKNPGSQALTNKCSISVWSLLSPQPTRRAETHHSLFVCCKSDSRAVYL